MEFAISRIISDLIIDLNAEFEERGGQDYDFKSVFKKTDKINDLSKSILSSYKKMLSRKRIETFSELIENSSQ